MKKIIAVILSLILTLTMLTACGEVKAQNLIDGVKPLQETGAGFEDNINYIITDTSFDIFNALTAEDENVVFSPLSVIYALSMTANGANGETLAQMEKVLGADINSLNNYIDYIVDNLPSGEGYTLDIANSIWFKDDENKFKVNEDFLRTVATFYDAGIYKAPFDNTTLKDINNWVAQNTDGQITDILDKIDKDAIMYLVNAINFEAEWAKIYKENQVRDGEFTGSKGEKQPAEFMYSKVNTYISGENYKGFAKNYKGGQYTFVALLPDEGVTAEELIKQLSEKPTDGILYNSSPEKVYTSIPKFENTFDTEMSEILKALGMPDAFDSRVSDFSKMGEATVPGENICINRVIHKAHIRVAEKGTQAGAATVVEMVGESAAEPVQEPKEVYLDRPFVYMIMDTVNELPIFMGAVNSVI